MYKQKVYLPCKHRRMECQYLKRIFLDHIFLVFKLFFRLLRHFSSFLPFRTWATCCPKSPDSKKKVIIVYRTLCLRSYSPPLAPLVGGKWVGAVADRVRLRQEEPEATVTATVSYLAMMSLLIWHMQHLHHIYHSWAHQDRYSWLLKNAFLIPKFQDFLQKTQCFFLSPTSCSLQKNPDV